MLWIYLTPKQVCKLNLFDQLKASHSDEWEAYTRHNFVKQLGLGTVPKEAFQHYLKQDYLFLIEFAKCFALAAYKSTSLDDIKRAKEGLVAITDLELDLHLKYCAEWGIDRADLDGLVSSPANKAYTDYVMKCGLNGNLLDLYVALSPCAVGYGEIGRRLKQSSAADISNPYQDWIDMYSSEDYLESVEDMKSYLDKLAGPKLSEVRLAELSKIFKTATCLEANFWQMGLDLS